MFSLLKGVVSEEAFEVDNSLNNFINDILFANVHSYDIIDKCSDFDVIDIFKMLHKVEEEVNYLKLENMVLIDFLEQNDPKMLFGLSDSEIAADVLVSEQTKREEGKIKFNVQARVQRMIREVGATSATSMTSNVKKSAAQSLATIYEARVKDYRLNYKSKVDLTTKLAKKVRHDINHRERNMEQNIKQIFAEMEEIKYSIKEADDCRESFDRNVVILGTDPNTNHISAEKFIIFSKNFYNTGMGLMSNLRINLNCFDQDILTLRNEVSSKSEMGGILRKVDFDLMMIKKLRENKTYEDQMNTVHFLKDYHGKVSYTLSYKRKELIQTETELKKLQTKIEILRKSVESIEKEFEYCEQEVESAQKNLDILQNKFETFTAPQISSYIALKETLHNLEKEKKILKQKMYLLNIRLKNAKQKYKSSK